MKNKKKISFTILKAAILYISSFFCQAIAKSRDDEPQKHIITEARQAEAPRKLRVVFTSLNTEFYKSAEAAYRADGGDPERVRQEIQDYIKTPLGKKIFAQDGTLTISATNGGTINAPIGGTHINYDGGKKNAIAHEIGHTIYGGSYCDYLDQIEGCGTTYPVGNVENHENVFRTLTGQKPRKTYTETDVNHKYYVQTFKIKP